MRRDPPLVVLECASGSSVEKGGMFWVNQSLQSGGVIENTFCVVASLETLFRDSNFEDVTLMNPDGCLDQ